MSTRLNNIGGTVSGYPSPFLPLFSANKTTADRLRQKKVGKARQRQASAG